MSFTTLIHHRSCFREPREGGFFTEANRLLRQSLDLENLSHEDTFTEKNPCYFYKIFRFFPIDFMLTRIPLRPAVSAINGR